MSTPSSTRSSTRSIPPRPSTPDQTRPSVTRTGSFSVAPKSKYLQNALQARRAHNTPVPPPLEIRSPATSATPAESKIPRSASSDDDAEFTLTEEQMAPVSPVRRRRPSDAGLPRSKTNRELTDEIARLKDALITTNMRVELLKKNNSELQHGITKAKERAEELEPLQDENDELRDENNHLQLQMQDLEQEIARVRDENDNVRKLNEELLAINEECASHYEEQESAVQEAADTIIALETDKSKLAAEFKKLLDRVTALEQGASQASTLYDGSPGYPTRVYSIDESRPSTSHFDSDYYSQPASPQVKPSTDSVVSFTPSERSKKFLNSTDERRRSTRDLIKRMSAASLKAISIRCPSPAPEVPEIPAAFQQYVPQIVEQPVTDNITSRTPKRYRERRLPQQPLLDALQVSPTKSGPKTPHSLSPRSERLHEHSSSEQMRVVRPPPSRRSNSTTMSKPRSRQTSGNETSPRIPSRVSSRVAHTSSSNEHMSQRNRRDPQHRRQSEPEFGFAEVKVNNGINAWASSSMPPPPVPVARSEAASIVSESDLTEVDPTESRNDWWRGVDRLNQPRPHPLSGSTQATDVFQPTSSRPPASPSLVRSKSHITQAPAPRLDIASRVMKTPSKERGLNGVRMSRTQPNTPDTTPYGENFFFNGAEDVDTFIRKTKNKLPGRR